MEVVDSDRQRAGRGVGHLERIGQPIIFGKFGPGRGLKDSIGRGDAGAKPVDRGEDPLEQSQIPLLVI
jgi:hypothetical protein